MSRSTKWLVTGGAGFIGRNLLRRLVAENAGPIRVVDDLSVGSREDLFGAVNGTVRETVLTDVLPMSDVCGVELVVADITVAESALAVVAGADIVIHLAANAGVPQSIEHPRADCMTNVIGTLNYLEACRAHSVGRFVFASSSAPIGECTPPVHEELAPHPLSPYGASKLAGEGYCSAYFRSYGIETVALRFGNVYGPGSGHKASVVARFIGQGLRGEVLEIFGDGTQTRDFLYIDDLTAAVYRAAITPGVGGEVFQIATGGETTLHELSDAIAEAFEARGLSRPAIALADARKGDIVRNYSDVRKAAAHLGWSADVSLTDGIARTLNDFVDEIATR